MTKAAIAVAAVVVLAVGTEGRGTDAAPLAGHVDAPLETGLAGSGSQPAIRVLVNDTSHAFTRQLSAALETTAGVYERAGVHVIWVSQAVDRDGRAALTVVIEPSTEVRKDLPHEALGVASDPGDGTRGSLAYVFGDRVTTFADSYHLSVAAVLGCALAHEIGHLLLPVNAHHAGGIMRASWQPDLFPPRTAGLLGFVPEQARVLPLRVRGR
jgi:hypothetical protein